MKNKGKGNSQLQRVVLWLAFIVIVIVAGRWAMESKSLQSGLPVKATTASSLASVQMISAAEGKALLKKLVALQGEEIRARERLYQSDLKQLKVSQKEGLYAWEASEKEARHLFFKDHQNGPERRTYIQDFLKRREQFIHERGAEKEQLKRDLEEDILGLKAIHSENLIRAKTTIESGMMPDEDVWPKSK